MISKQKNNSDAVNNPTPVEIGRTIARLRTAKRLTQEGLGEALGVSFQAISKWETGLCFPELPFLMQLAEMFDTSVDDIISSGAGKSSKGNQSKERFANTVFEEMDKGGAPPGIYQFNLRGLQVSATAVNIDSESTTAMSTADNIYLHVSKEFDGIWRNEPNENPVLLFHAISHPARCEIIRSLMGVNGKSKTKSREQLRTECNIEMSELNNHIDVLGDADIIRVGHDDSIHLPFKGMLVASAVPALTTLFYKLTESW